MATLSHAAQQACRASLPVRLSFSPQLAQIILVLTVSESIFNGTQSIRLAWRLSSRRIDPMMLGGLGGRAPTLIVTYVITWSFVPFGSFGALGRSSPPSSPLADEAAPD